MAERPWVTPEEVREYTSSKEVAERTEEKLKFDIARAESTVIAKTNNNFLQDKVIPEPVKIAVILLAEAYGKNSIELMKSGRLKSESFDDYSYSMDDSTVNIDDLGLDDLLAPFVVASGRGKAILKLRKL